MCIRDRTTSEPALLSLINGAEHDLFVENEEMSSREITDALAAAARRGVNVEICMTNSSSWSSEFATLVGAGVHLSVYAPDAPLYIHAKVLVRDPGAADQEAFVGSQNFSTESLLYNRELGICLLYTSPVSRQTPSASPRSHVRRESHVAR